jgi:hypothetical protein
MVAPVLFANNIGQPGYFERPGLEDVSPTEGVTNEFLRFCRLPTLTERGIGDGPKRSEQCGRRSATA